LYLKLWNKPYTEKNMSRSQVFEWYRRFCDVRRLLGDEKGPTIRIQLSEVATLVKHVKDG